MDDQGNFGEIHPNRADVQAAPNNEDNFASGDGNRDRRRDNRDDRRDRRDDRGSSNKSRSRSPKSASSSRRSDRGDRDRERSRRSPSPRSRRMYGIVFHLLNITQVLGVQGQKAQRNVLVQGRFQIPQHCCSLNIHRKKSAWDKAPPGYEGMNVAQVASINPAVLMPLIAPPTTQQTRQSRRLYVGNLPPNAVDVRMIILIL